MSLDHELSGLGYALGDGYPALRMSGERPATRRQALRLAADLQRLPEDVDDPAAQEATSGLGRVLAAWAFKRVPVPLRDLDLGYYPECDDARLGSRRGPAPGELRSGWRS